MKKLALLILFLGLSSSVLDAQTLEEFNIQRLDMNQKGMMVLGSWAVANIALSPMLAGQSRGSRKYFHQMNGYWNGVNLIIAGFGFYNALNADPSAFSLSETVREQQTLEKVLLFNAGLDLAYISAGLYLTEKAKNTAKNRDRLKGFGQSVMLQGGFLFLFDVTFYLIQKEHGGLLLDFVDELSLRPSGFGLIWQF